MGRPIPTVSKRPGDERRRQILFGMEYSRGEKARLVAGLVRGACAPGGFLSAVRREICKSQASKLRSPGLGLGSLVTLVLVLIGWTRGLRLSPLLRLRPLLPALVLVLFLLRLLWSLFVDRRSGLGLRMRPSLLLRARLVIHRSRTRGFRTRRLRTRSFRTRRLGARGCSAGRGACPSGRIAGWFGLGAGSGPGRFGWV